MPDLGAKATLSSRGESSTRCGEKAITAKPACRSGRSLQAARNPAQVSVTLFRDRIVRGGRVTAGRTHETGPLAPSGLPGCWLVRQKLCGHNAPFAKKRILSDAGVPGITKFWLPRA